MEWGYGLRGDGEVVGLLERWVGGVGVEEGAA